ncbi:MAG: Fic family protein [Acidimicrobiales bacterium]
MRSFQDPSTLDPVPGVIVALLRRIDLAAGRHAISLDQLPQLLDALRHHARVESVTASSAIEGVVVEAQRAPGLLAGRTSRVRNRSEAEFAGYRTALDYLYAGDPGDLSVGLVLHLHRQLFSYTESDGGRFKSTDNLVVDQVGDTRRLRFTPVSTRETPWFTEELVVRTHQALTEGLHHPLLVITAFVLDLLCIHPFDDGNGRVARLATTHLLDRSGYGVGRYVSIEQLLFDTRTGYYDALARSTVGWSPDGRHSLWPWAEYLLGQMAVAYERFEASVVDSTWGGTKQDRVRDFVLTHAPVDFTIADIRRALPGVSDNTIRLVLTELRRRGGISVDGTGRNARWRRE